LFQRRIPTAAATDEHGIEAKKHLAPEQARVEHKEAHRREPNRLIQQRVSSGVRARQPDDQPERRDAHPADEPGIRTHIDEDQPAQQQIDDQDAEASRRAANRPPRRRRRTRRPNHQPDEGDQE
jgi:hypothetical protein